MPIGSVDLGLVWVCRCCMLAHCNGECCADHEGPEPLSTMAHNFGWSIAVDSTGVTAPFRQYTWTAGLLPDEHADDCLIKVYGDRQHSDVPGDYECECDRRTFSRSSCDGCGIREEGERYALTLWREPVPHRREFGPGAGPAPVARLAA